MFFQQKNKLTFGSGEEDSDILADKLQAIVNLACAYYESDLLDPRHKLDSSTMWRLSNYFESNSISFDVESKIIKAYKAIKKRKEDKDKILEKIALKYKLDVSEDISDNDTEYSSDLFMNTEEDDDLLDSDTTILNKDKNYFGKKAKDRFWNLYKSGRTFKDHSKEEIKDPRFAYIKTCHDLKMLPKAGMIIRGEKTTHLSYAHFGLLHKNSMAVAESLKRYPLEIESLDFTGNGIKASECIMLVEALESHCATLQHLNFSDNKIGHDGAIALSDKIIKMKQLESLSLDGNLLGDDSMSEILKSANTLLNLKSLNLSNNALGHKVTDSEFAEALCSLLRNTGSLIELDLSWNNLRGEAAESILLAVKENYTLK